MPPPARSRPDRRRPSAPAHGNCRRRHGRRSARSAPSRRCRPRSRRCIRQAARSARRHRSKGRARRAAASATPSRRRAAPSRASCAPPPRWSTGTARRRIRRRSRRSSPPARRRLRRCRGTRRTGTGSPDSRASNRLIMARICSALTSSMRATGMPIWIVAITAWQAASTLGKRAHAARDRLRDAVELQRQRGDDAERAFRADRAAASGRSRPSSSSPARRS